MQNALTAIMEIKKATGNYDPRLEIKKLLLSQQHIVLGALQRLGFVHFGRFVFMDLGGKQYFAIITSYDFDFDDYINIFIDELGDMFNEMLKHIDHGMNITKMKDERGKEVPLNVRQYRREFIEYVRRVDLTNPQIIQDTQMRVFQPRPLESDDKIALFYSAYPNLSVQHISKLEKEAYA